MSTILQRSPPHSMTADTICASRIDELQQVLEIALVTIRHLNADIAASDVTPEDAATIVNETVATITAAAQ